jgi:hypothetical protein
MVEERSGVDGSFFGDVRSRDKGGQTTWVGDDRRPPAPSALQAMSTATKNRAAHWTRRPSRVVKIETGH